MLSIKNPAEFLICNGSFSAIAIDAKQNKQIIKIRIIIILVTDETLFVYAGQHYHM